MKMVDVGGKEQTERTAVATGRVRMLPATLDRVRRRKVEKGDVIAAARLAGVMAAKRTPDLVPLCHPIALSGVTVDVQLGESTVDITATTRTADRTGVEMEALTAVVTAGLALYDMIKAVDRSAVLGEVRLLAKSGGRSGQWRRDG